MYYIFIEKFRKSKARLRMSFIYTKTKFKLQFNYIFHSSTFSDVSCKKVFKMHNFFCRNWNKIIKSWRCSSCTKWKSGSFSNKLIWVVDVLVEWIWTGIASIDVRCLEVGCAFANDWDTTNPKKIIHVTRCLVQHGHSVKMREVCKKNTI